MESRASLRALINVVGSSGALGVSLPHGMRKPKQMLHWRGVRDEQCMAELILNCHPPQQF